MSAIENELTNEEPRHLKEVPKPKEGEIVVTLGQLLDGIGETPNLPPNGPLARLYAKRFPEGKGQLGHRFKRLMRDVLAEIDTFQPTKKELFEKYGTSDDQGQQYRIEGENVAKFMDEMNDARSVEIVLRHSQMPELRDIWEVSPAEDDMLTWLVGE